MKKGILITCGCSWTYGVGVGYTNHMTLEEHMATAWDEKTCDNLSFRGILAKKYGLDTVNFSEGGSSNQRQFRLIKEYFASSLEQLLNEYENVIVLHGITSTARNELYINDKSSLVNFKYDISSEEEWSKAFVTHFYDHDNEVNRLADEMRFINVFYNTAGIKNLWFDTFNHHTYGTDIANLLGAADNPRDLLSVMAIHNGFDGIDDEYHKSSWVVDSPRVAFLIEKGHLNPISKHPTEKGHKLIAEIIDTQIGQMI